MLSVALLVGILLVILVSLFLQWRSVKRYWADRNVPFEPPHPILGNLRFLFKDNTAVYMKKLYSKYRVPYVGIWWFWKPILVIQCPEIARRIMVKDAHNFKDRHARSSVEYDPIGALNLFLLREPLWTPTRRRLASVFSQAKLKNVFELIDTKTSELLHRINSQLKENRSEPMDLRRLFMDFTSDVIGKAAFGLNCDALLGGPSPMKAVVDGFATFKLSRTLSWITIFFHPKLAQYAGSLLFPKPATDYLRTVFRQAVEERGGYDKNIEEPSDLLDTLIKMKQEADLNKKVINEDLLVAQAAVYILGGFDTSSTTLTFTLHELSFQPELQEKLYQELKARLVKGTNTKYDFNTLAELPYLNSVIKESLRLYPPMGWLDRSATESYKIDDNLTIPAGMPILINAMGMQVDPEYFPDPYKYNPDRFMPENQENVKPFTNMPFGEGPRSCAGRRFALQVLRYALASLVTNYQFRRQPDAPKPTDVKIDPRGFFYTPADRVYMNFIPRKTEN